VPSSTQAPVGLAARYVSGYLETDPPFGEPKLQGADASHAWCSVYVPPFGWVDVDPTNDQLPPRRHITIGWGRDYADIAPLRGVLIGPPASQDIEVAVDVIAQGD
jgi:transglutaminase-like putative cysteine protease